MWTCSVEDKLQRLILSSLALTSSPSSFLLIISASHGFLSLCEANVNRMTHTAKDAAVAGVTRLAQRNKQTVKNVCL